MNKEEMTRHQTSEVSSVTSFAEAHYCWGKLPPTNVNKKFFLTLMPYSCRIPVIIMMKNRCLYFTSGSLLRRSQVLLFTMLYCDKPKELPSLSVTDIVIPSQTYTGKNN